MFSNSNIGLLLFITHTLSAITVGILLGQLARLKHKFKNNIFKFIKDKKKQEYYNSLGAIRNEADRNTCNKLVAHISEYRNKIVGHNMLDSPKLTFDIRDADFVISQYEKVFNVLSFQNERYAERVADLADEKARFIEKYLDAVLPLN